MFVLPNLPYDYKALEPWIDGETMHIHHDKHHAAYIDNLNKLLEGKEDLFKMDVNDLLKDLSKVPEDIRQKVVNNAGGHLNHSLFWKFMAPSGPKEPSGKLLEAVNKTFGSFQVFKEKFTQTGVGRFGSGWAWLVKDGSELKIIDTLNQDSPVSKGLIPILCLDVWEHAYYLKYQNKRVDYINAWWNVVNWKEVERLFENA